MHCPFCEDILEKGNPDKYTAFTIKTDQTGKERRPFWILKEDGMEHCFSHKENVKILYEIIL